MEELIVLIILTIVGFIGLTVMYMETKANNDESPYIIGVIIGLLLGISVFGLIMVLSGWQY